MNRIQQIALAGLVVAGLATPAMAGQQTVGPADIQRLQDSVWQGGIDIQQLRSRDAARATQLQSQLDDLRDEVIYLKVKLRKEGTLARTEYTSLRDRVDDLRSQATNTTSTASSGNSNTGVTVPSVSLPATSAPSPAPAPRPTAPAAAPRPSSTASASASGTVEVPTGTELDVRLTNSLSSGTAQVEDRFEGTTLVDLTLQGKTVIPSGSVMRGVVTAVEPATRTNRTGKMTVSFDQVTINGRAFPIRGTVTQAIEGEGIKGETGRIATGAGVGAILGGILGGFKGALAGILIGGGGTIAATEGKQVELPQGSVLRVRLDSPVQMPTTSAR